VRSFYYTKILHAKRCELMSWEAQSLQRKDIGSDSAIDDARSIFIASSRHSIPYGDVDRRVTVSFAATERDMSAPTSMLVPGQRADRPKKEAASRRPKLSASQTTLHARPIRSRYAPTSGNWSDWQRAEHMRRSAPPDADASATSPKLVRQVQLPDVQLSHHQSPLSPPTERCIVSGLKAASAIAIRSGGV
jgi:hypothetical protein